MDGPTTTRHVIRFSVFELDLESGELFKQGRKVRLQGLPFEILAALAQRPGEVVTREDLRQKGWSSDTFIDFDQALNRAINKVRDALGDSAETPLFVQTVPRRGYRFIASVQQERAAPAIEEAQPQPHRRSFRWIVLASALVISAGFLWFAMHSRTPKGPVEIQQLTTNSAENPIEGAVMSPDGKYLAYADRAGIQLRLISTGESHVLPRPDMISAGDVWAPVAWFPDQSHLLASSVQLMAGRLVINAWSVAVIGGAAVLLQEHALAQSVSPDGSLIAFTRSRATNWENSINTPYLSQAEIWLMGPHGENSRSVVRGDDQTAFGVVRWSPDGRRLAYATSRSMGGMAVRYAIESRELRGGPDHIIFQKTQRARFTPGVALDLRLPDFAWLPDNRIVFPMPEASPKSRDSNLWAIELDPSSGNPRGQLRRLTSLANFHMQAVSASEHGRVIFESTTDESHVYVATIEPDGSLRDGRRLTLDQRYNTPYGWTSDSSAVIFSSDRTGRFAFYKQRLDADVPELIPTGPESAPQARVSPDGASLIYASFSNPKDPEQSDSVRMMTVPLSGGPPKLLFEVKSAGLDFDCPHRAGAQCIASEWDAQHREQIFFEFDPSTGMRHDLFRTSPAPNWTVSPDGSHIAASRQDHIEVWSLSGQVEKKLELQGWPRPLSMSIDWAADGKALFVSHQGLTASPGGPIGSTLLRVDLEGHVKPIWETRGARFTWGIASPNGKYLAIREPAIDRNAWMIENF